MNKVSAAQECENYLLDEKEDLATKEIQPSRILIIDRLLNNSLNMKAVYEELISKLPKDHHWKYVIEWMIDGAYLWDSAKTNTIRNERSQLDKTNNSIKKVALELAGLIDQRTELKEYGHSSDSFCGIVSAIDAAGEDNPYYSRVKNELKPLSGRFDLKYWPSISDILRAISENASNAEFYHIEPSTEAAIDSRKSGLYDYFRGIFHSLEELYNDPEVCLPSDFRLSDNSLAIVASCSLDLNDELEEGYVKRARQAIRTKNK